jgi:hypothetical protein
MFIVEGFIRVLFLACWLNVFFWKGSNWATGSGVRIPVSPPNIFYSCISNQSLISFKNAGF